MDFYAMLFFFLIFVILLYLFNYPDFIFDRTPESYSCNPPILKFLVNDSDVPNFSPISGSYIIFNIFL
jgi:hypothetical protein